MLDHSINDDVLFGRLRRLVATATTLRHSDRRNLLSLETDIRALRAELTRRCAVLTAQMNDAGQRTTAFGAYARTVSLARNHAPTRSPTE